MLFYAGIDEAGYGPMLGPLCVGMSAFLVENHEEGGPPPNLWEALEEGVCSSSRDKRRRIAVADSKKLKGAAKAKSHPLRHLERGVLAFLSTLNDEPILDDLDDSSLFQRLGADLPTTVSTPWYRSTTKLPLAHEPDLITIAAARLRTVMQAAGIRPVAMACTSIDAGDLNARLASGANKAMVNQDAVLQQIFNARNAAETVGIELPRIVVDRQGGRAYYREWLSTCIEGAKVRVIGETDRVSRYQVDDARGGFIVSFESGSEDRHLPVALASMIAKYSRELAMLRMNRFFTEQMPELRPTAGYVQDGRRFMAEVAPMVESLKIDRKKLVRSA